MSLQLEKTRKLPSESGSTHLKMLNVSRLFLKQLSLVQVMTDCGYHAYIKKKINGLLLLKLPTQGAHILSQFMRKPTFWFPTRSDAKQAVQSQKMARGLKFGIYEVEGLYYPSSENKGADQLCGYREADLRLCFRICKMKVFS